MKLSYNWLTEFIDLPLNPYETAEKLTLIGLEEEETFEFGCKLEGVIVGEVLETSQHPNADKLTLCQVNLGEETVQIVCGAPNVAAGQKVPVATVGSTLPIKLNDGSYLKLKKAKLRGEESHGMICAEDELGLGDNHNGIMILDKSLKVGTPIADIFDPYFDTIMDIAITPNRPDATGHLGVARDLSAALNVPLKKPVVHVSTQVTECDDISVSIENSDKCHRFVGKMIKNVKIKESPKWLKNKLEAIGSRPINNVVDVTNYIMFELGQPLHAYDYDAISDKKIIVKDFEEEIEFETLDHSKRKCAPGTLFICDGNGPIGIAGVMGGVYSEVSNKTTNIFLEGAYFDPGTVRKTAKAQILQTDASYRFERGVDPNNQAYAVERAAKLIQEVAGGTLAKELLDIHPNVTERKQITLRKSYLNRLLGTDLSMEEAVSIVDGLELEVITKDEDAVTFSIPTFRPDLEREVDLIEEVARLYDYNKIDAPNHGIFVSTETFSNWEILMEKIRKAGVELGFREIYTNSLISEKEAEHYGSLDTMIGALNPLTADMTTLRPSLLHGFLKAAAYNFNRQASNIRFFECGNVFEVGETSYHDGIHEQTQVLFGIAGFKTKEHWSEQPKAYSVFDLKKEISGFLHKLNLTNYIIYKEIEGALVLSYAKREIGRIEIIDTKLLKNYGIEFPTYTAEFSINAIVEVLSKTNTPEFTPIPKYPPFEFDFAVIIDQHISAGKLITAIKSNVGKKLLSLDIFDVFEGESIGKDKKSIAFRLNFIDPNKTLNIKVVEPIIQRIVKTLQKQFSAKLRG